MAAFLKLAGAYLALSTLVRAAPFPPDFTESQYSEERSPYHEHVVRNLLGSSFGVPGSATYDYVVVGAGNAGLVVAARLAEDPSVSVALVEAGSFYEISNGNHSQIPAEDTFFAGKDVNDTNNLVDWNFVTTPQAGAYGVASHYARGKTLGGNTARNYMTYHLATAGAYQQWADQVGDQAYSYQNFLPYFKKSVHFTPPNTLVRMANATPVYDPTVLGYNGPVSLTFHNHPEAFGTYAIQGLPQIGVPVINGFQSGKLIGASYALATVNRDLGYRETSETAYLRPGLGSVLNLQVFQSTMAKKIIFSGTQATGVQVDSEGEVYTLSARKEVIVSAGAFHSPQLLMVSGIGPAATLSQFGIPVVANLPGVGQNMQDHILFGPSYRLNVVTQSQLSFPGPLAKANAEFNGFPASGPLCNPGQDVLGFEKIPQSVANYSAAAQAQLATLPSDWPHIEILNVNGYFGYQTNFQTEAPTDGYNYATIATALVAPFSRGTVTIKSTDTNDLPIVNPNWLTNEVDVEVAVAAFKRARMLFNSQAVSKILIGQEYFPGPQVQTDAQILDLIRKAFNTVFHAACTCAMGNSSNPNAVVDSHAKVYGTQGLRVVDASAMPFLPPGHPMSTIYALAEKIADDIKNGN